MLWRPEGKLALSGAPLQTGNGKLESWSLGSDQVRRLADTSTRTSNLTSSNGGHGLNQGSGAGWDMCLAALLCPALP